jgi:hypothetical protein
VARRWPLEPVTEGSNPSSPALLGPSRINVFNVKHFFALLNFPQQQKAEELFYEMAKVEDGSF